jgi:hypothetical protein
MKIRNPDISHPTIGKYNIRISIINIINVVNMPTDIGTTNDKSHPITRTANISFQDLINKIIV